MRVVYFIHSRLLILTSLLTFVVISLAADPEVEVTRLSVSGSGAAAVSGVLYVNDTASGANDGSSWVNAFSDLQSALSAATSGDEIWIAAGTYKPSVEVGGSGSRYATFQMVNGVGIYGGFAGTETTRDEREWETHITILSGDIGTEDYTPDNAYHLFCHPDGYILDSTALLDGVTITGGVADGYEYGHEARGGAMYNTIASPTITNCTFFLNHATYGGAVLNDSSTTTITNCTFSQNMALLGGAIIGTATITNCTFNNNHAYSGGAISGSATTTNCTFTQNTADWDGGAILHHGGAITGCTFSMNTSGGPGGAIRIDGEPPTITNCTFIQNTATTSSGGAVFCANAGATFTNCTFSRNSANEGGAVFASIYDGTLRFANCSFSLNSAPNGGAVYDGSMHGASNIFTNCILWGNSSDIVTDEYGASPEISFSIVQSGNFAAGSDPLFVDPANDNLRLQFGSPAINAGSNSLLPADSADLDGNLDATEPIPYDLDDRARIVETTVDMGPFEYVHYTGPIWYVDVAASGANDGSDWRHAFTDLQSALSAAASGDEIWVAAGTYKPSVQVGGTGDRYATFQMVNGVGIYGGFAGTETARDERDWETHITILSGDIGTEDYTPDNTYHLFLHPDGYILDSTALLDGVTIAGGVADGYANQEARGGAMYNASVSPTITNCTFSQNQAVHGGAMYNTNASPTITNCTFSQNQAEAGGGGIVQSYSSPTITNCTFSQNQANWGGGMWNSNSSPTITNCTFSLNKADYAGGIDNTNASPTITNCTFSQNQADADGGGMSNWDSSPTITNCTFSQNKARWRAGGMDNQYYSSPTISNCILWGNGTEIDNQDSTPIVTYSIVQDGYSNLYADPLFVDPANDNLRLQPGSPAINAGSNAALPADTTDLDGDSDTAEPVPYDLDGNARVKNGTVDMGAYEAALPPPVANADSYSLLGNATLTVAAPGVLTNDTADAGNPLTAVLVANVSHGALSLHADGSFTYTPTTGYVGEETFTYKANDGYEESNAATVTIAVPAIHTVTFDLDGKAIRTGGGELVQQVVHGASATAPTVQANTGWTFTGWDALFDAITSNLTVIAQYEVTTYTVNFDLDGKGSRTGGGELVQQVGHGGAAVAPTVQANLGWAFTGWDLPFTNITTNLSVTALYTSEPIDTPTWANPVGMANSMAVYARVQLLPDAVMIETEGSLLAAFKDGVCRGVTTIAAGPMVSTYSLQVFSDAGSEAGFTLRVWDAATGQIHDIMEGFDFVQDTAWGGIGSPVTLHAGLVTQTISLVQNWNWISFNTLPESWSPNVVLGTERWQNEDTIKGPGGIATFYGDQWYGAQELAAGVRFLLKVQGAGPEPLVVTGTPVPLEPLSLVAGWNWLGYTPQSAMAISDALASLPVTNDDTLKCPSFLVTNYDGIWYPEGAEMQPGVGYLLKLATAGTLSYPGTSVGAPAVSEVGIAAAPGWENPSGYANSMEVYAKVMDGSTPMQTPGSLLAAFKGDTLRGVAGPSAGPAGQLYILQVFSDETNESGLTYKFYDAASDTIYDIAQGLDFVSNGAVGGITTPVELDALIVPTIDIADSSVYEGDTGTTPLTFTVTLGRTWAEAVTVAYATTDGTAIAPADYVAANGVLTIPAGSLTATIAVAINGDYVDELDETLTVTLSNPVNGVLGDATATGTIRNNDTAVLSIADASKAEGDVGVSVVQVSVTLDLPSDRTVTVEYATASVTATAGVDYIEDTGTVTFAPGDTSETIDIDIVGDTIDEANESFEIHLSNVTNAGTADTTATVMIIDDDTAVLGIADAQVAEDGGQVTLTVSTLTAADRVMTVNVATADGTATAPADYTAVNTQLIFAPGVTSQQVVVTILDDETVEGDESFTVNLSGATIATIGDGSATVTITDDDVPQVSVNSVSALEGSALTFTLSLDRSSPFVASVDYATANDTATAGSDYVSTSGTATFAANQMTATVVVQSIQDELHEGLETFTLTLSNPTMLSLGEAVGVGTIEDNDPPWLLLTTAAAAISEGGGTTVGTVTRNTDTGAELVVDLTSSDTTEAVVPATVTIAAGSSTATFVVSAADDEDFDGNVQVTLTASDIDHMDGTVTLTITDDEQSENLVYTFTIRGTQYGDGVVPQAGNGYLVLDLRDHQASAVVRWQDGSGDRIDFPGWYTADIGASNIWVLHVSDFELAGPAAIGDYAYGHMFGTMHPSEVPLGGGVTGPAAVSFAGPWRGGAPFGQPTLVEMGDMSARFDYARTQQENTSNTPFEVLLVELAEDAGFQLPEFDRQVETEVAGTAELEGQGIACYNLTWSGVNAGENAVQSFSYPGYLLLDLSTGEMQALLAWRQGTQWYYTIETWSEGVSFAYPLTVGSSTYTFLGNRQTLQVLSQPEDYRFRFMYGANRTLKIGLPSNEPQALPMSLSGNLWGHFSPNEEGGTYTQSTITCGINGGMTLTINQESMTLDQAMDHVRSTLTNFIRD